MRELKVGEEVVIQPGALGAPGPDRGLGLMSVRTQDVGRIMVVSCPSAYEGYFLLKPKSGQRAWRVHRDHLKSVGERLGEAEQGPNIIRSFASQEVRSESETGGAKGEKTARYDQIPAVPLRLLAEKYGKGNAKYPPGENGLDNWRNGYDFSKSFAAMQRHAWAFWSGEDFDPDSEGELHLTAAAWHCFAMIEWLSRPEIRKRYDDRQDPRNPLEVTA